MATVYLFGLWNSLENLKPSQTITYHRGIEAAHGGKLSSFTKLFARLRKVVGVSGPFDISQAFAPGWWGHKPQEGECSSHHQVLAENSTQ